MKENLVNAVSLTREEPHLREEHTGLHPLEFIETTRFWFDAPFTLQRCDSVSVLNLVQGSAAVVSSPTGAFPPFSVHYAETFILPAGAGEYTISPATAGEACAVLRAEVRG